MSRVQLFILKLFLSVQGALTHNCEYNRTNELARSASSYQFGISKIPKIIIQNQYSLIKGQAWDNRWLSSI